MSKNRQSRIGHILSRKNKLDSSRKRNSIQDPKRQSHARFEILEERTLLANYLLLDFTPDNIAGEYQVNRFADMFAGQAANETNSHLNIAGGETVDSLDASAASSKIASRVRQIFYPFEQSTGIDFQVRYTTNLTSTADPGIGEKWLQENGIDSERDNVYVIYIGGDRPSENVPRFGMSIQAKENENNEMYAYVFAGELSDYLTETFQAAIPKPDS